MQYFGADLLEAYIELLCAMNSVVLQTNILASRNSEVPDWFQAFPGLVPVMTLPSP
jgi:hypothetical protein